MAKREKKSDDGGGYSYMDTYGDMVTLLLTFFVLLFAFSSVDDAKWNDLVQAFTGMPPRRVVTAIDLLDTPNFSDVMPLVIQKMKQDEKKNDEMVEVKNEDGTVEQVPINDLIKGWLQLDNDTQKALASEEYIAITAQFNHLFDELTHYIETEGLENMLFAEKRVDSIHIQVTAGVLFDSGKAELLPDYLPMLDSLEAMMATSLDGLGSIEVEGHTDDVPIRNARFHNNRDLSSARANAVVDYLQDKGHIPPDMLLGLGYGEYHPIVPNDSEENKQMNRRVQFVLKKKELKLADIAADADNAANADSAANVDNAANNKG